MGPDPDPEFPSCCATCPHRDAWTASCTHALSQSIIREVNEDQSCPVYASEKTAAMRRLAESL